MLPKRVFSRLSFIMQKIKDLMLRKADETMNFKRTRQKFCDGDEMEFYFYKPKRNRFNGGKTTAKLSRKSKLLHLSPSKLKFFKRHVSENVLPYDWKLCYLPR